MPATAKRASHIDPPKSPSAIMRRASPERGENSGPGKGLHRELDPGPGIREQPGSRAGMLTGSSERIAVGTQVTPRPPHRSVRAQLRHTAPALGGDDEA